MVELCDYFRELYYETSTVSRLEGMECSLVVTLCKLERMFSPAIFDVTVRLTVPLASEAKVAGPVQVRSIYSIDRFAQAKILC